MWITLVNIQHNVCQHPVCSTFVNTQYDVCQHTVLCQNTVCLSTHSMMQVNTQYVCQHTVNIQKDVCQHTVWCQSTDNIAPVSSHHMHTHTHTRTHTLTHSHTHTHPYLAPSDVGTWCGHWWLRPLSTPCPQSVSQTLSPLRPRLPFLFHQTHSLHRSCRSHQCCKKAGSWIKLSKSHLMSISLWKCGFITVKHLLLTFHTQHFSLFWQFLGLQHLTWKQNITFRNKTKPSTLL